MLRFGGTYTWADGLAITVGAPTAYTPPTDQKDRGKAFVSMTYTLTNDSEQAFVYSTGGITKEITSGGERGHQIADIELPERPQISLVPGQSASWQEAYGVETAKGITLTYAVTSEQEPVRFSAEGTKSEATEEASGDVPPFEPFVGIQKFGGTYTYASGMKVSVGVAKAFTPGEYARGPKAKRYVQYDITVVNGSRETFEPGDLSYGLSESGTQVGAVTDADQGIDVRPDGRIPPGSKYTLKVAFGVDGTKNHVLDVRIRDNPPAVFTTITVPEYTASEPGGTGTSAPGTSSAPTTTTREPSDDQVDAEVALTGAAEVKIGATLAWKNKVTVSVSAPEAFTTSRDLRHPEGTRAVKVTVTVTNGSAEPLTSYVRAEASSKNRPVSSIIDFAAEVGDANLSVEPGRKASFDVGWWVLDPADLVIVIQPDNPYTAGYFTSTGPQRTDAFQPSEGATGTADVALTFREKFTYTSGVTISVDVAPAGRVGSVAGDDKSFFAVSATVTNNSDEIVRFSWSPRVSSGNASGERFTNENEGIGVIGLRDLLPGRTITQVVGMSLTDTSEITVASRDPSYYGPSLLWSE